jgi:hypothetical protein
MTTDNIIIIRWWIRVTCLGGFAFGVILPVWEEDWTWWGFVSISGFAIVAAYGYWRCIGVEIYLAKKMAGVLSKSYDP